MMKDNWLKDIQNRMADFEMEEPQGLWEDICAAEGKGAKVPVIGKSNNKILWFLIATAAVCLLLVGLFHKENLNDVVPTPYSHSGQNMIAKQGDAKENISLTEMYRPLVIVRSADNDFVHAEADTVMPVTVPKTDSAEQEDNIKPQSIKHQEQQNTTSPSYGYYAHTKKPAHEKSRFSVGIATSGGIGTDNHRLFHGASMAVASASCESEWRDRPLLGIMAMNKSSDTERKIAYHSPIRTGLSFAYRLNDRWSIESGITYALVCTDIHEGSTTNYIEENQRLHYIGIPIGASYKVYSWRNLDVYISSNLMAELCVDGQSHRKFIIAGNANGEEETISINSHPLQWSAGAKVGVQYNIIPQLSFYLEPGCIYYFDDHSSLETVFKEKPLDFNLNIGMRLSVGKTN